MVQNKTAPASLRRKGKNGRGAGPTPRNIRPQIEWDFEISKR